MNVKEYFRVLIFVSSLILSVYFYSINSFPNWAFLLYLLSASIFFGTFFPSWNIIKDKIVYNKVDLLISIGLLSATLLLYLFRISEITPGMWGDEVALGWMVEKLSHLGQFTPFINYNLGHPTPLIYLSIIPISLIGRSILALRLVSVVFGSLSVVAFYFLLRQYFDRVLSFSGAVILASSYVLIVVSRFGYEMSAAIFIAILSGRALVSFSKKPTSNGGALLGFTLGLGLYTYLSFRLLFIPFFLAIFFLVLNYGKDKLKISIVVAVSLLIVSLPLITYNLNNFYIANERVYSLSVFHQGLSSEEVIKELMGASKRTLAMFFIAGDPNPRQNPAGTTPIDLLTSTLFFSGLGYLLYKKPAIGIFILMFILVVLVGEIVTLEQIPEAHYYGLGHPNTLRISVAIPGIIFSVVWALSFIKNKIGQIFSQKKIEFMVIEMLVLVICLVNINRYFNQKPNIWIHKTNYVIALNIIDTLNLQKPETVTLSETLYRTEHFKYFLDKSISTTELLSPIGCSFDNLTDSLYIFWPLDFDNCTIADLEKFVENSEYEVSYIMNQWNGLDAVAMERQP